MNKKKEIALSGKLLRPLTVGEYAFISAGGQLLRTSPVISIKQSTDHSIKFETANSLYHLMFHPFQIATGIPYDERLPMCA